MNFDLSIREEFKLKNYANVIKYVEKHLQETREKLSEETLQYYLKSLSIYGIYDRAIKYLRWKSPKGYRTSKDSYQNVKKIKEVMTKEEISESILFDFYVSLIKIGEFENANKILKSIQKLYPQYIDDFMLVIMLLRCLKVSEAQEIMERSDFNGNQLMKIGTTFYTIGKYDLANKTILDARAKGFSNHFDSVFEKLYNITSEHLKTHKFVSMKYEYFRIDNELYQGDIIYASDVDEYYKNIDPYALKRTYMIWKIEGEKIYAFPVTNKIPKDIRRFKLFRQNYLNFDSDRSVKDDLVIINKKDVEKVQERLTSNDYLNVLSNIYSGIIVSGNEEKKQMMKKFIDEMYNDFNIEENDIIVAYKKEDKSAKNYLVLDMDEDNLYCLELIVTRTKAEPVNYNIKTINKRNELLRKNTSIKMDKRYNNKISDVKEKNKQKVIKKQKQG